jgi:cytochrome c oxidase cbb3-type subunit 3
MTTFASPGAEPSRERDRVFDHEYDGIREYDNPMPAWWVWIFAASIIFCFPYVMWYHLGAGPSIHDGYEGELAAYAAQLLETYGELEPDAPTILSFMDDDVAMAGMASLFKSKCAQCHLADGSGSVGPNLTDDSWINVKTLTDIPNVITTGVDKKGMPRWGDTLTKTQIVLISSYVARLRGHPVPGKAPQGEIIPPWGDGAGGAAPAPGS